MNVTGAGIIPAPVILIFSGDLMTQILHKTMRPLIIASHGEGAVAEILIKGEPVKAGVKLTFPSNVDINNVDVNIMTTVETLDTRPGVDVYVERFSLISSQHKCIIPYRIKMYLISRDDAKRRAMSTARSMTLSYIIAKGAIIAIAEICNAIPGAGIYPHLAPLHPAAGWLHPQASLVREKYDLSIDFTGNEAHEVVSRLNGRGDYPPDWFIPLDSAIGVVHIDRITRDYISMDLPMLATDIIDSRMRGTVADDYRFDDAYIEVPSAISDVTIINDSGWAPLLEAINAMVATDFEITLRVICENDRRTFTVEHLEHLYSRFTAETVSFVKPDIEKLVSGLSLSGSLSDIGVGGYFESIDIMIHKNISDVVVMEISDSDSQELYQSYMFDLATMALFSHGVITTG